LRQSAARSLAIAALAARSDPSCGKLLEHTLFRSGDATPAVARANISTFAWMTGGSGDVLPET